MRGSGLPAVLLTSGGLVLDLACVAILLRLIGPEAVGTPGFVLVGGLAMVWVPIAACVVSLALGVTLAGMGTGLGALVRARRRREPALEVLLGSLSILLGAGGVLALAWLWSVIPW